MYAMYNTGGVVTFLWHKCVVGVQNGNCCLNEFDQLALSQGASLWRSDITRYALSLLLWSAVKCVIPAISGGLFPSAVRR